MKNEKSYFKKRINHMVLCFSFLFWITNPDLQAQVVIGGDNKPQSYSVLELNSNEKGGLRLPRLTTEQRDQITKDAKFVDVKKDLARGLTIYNLDTNCEEYWNSTVWVSLCQSFPTSKVEMSSTDCGKIHVYGTYSQSAPLNNTHYILLPVTVTQKGNYYLLASGNNGYYFQASGVFETTGDFEIRLDGIGTPREEKIDSLIFSGNNAPINTQCIITVDVKEKSMGYRTDDKNIQVFGTYQTRQFMNTDNYAKVPINVIVTGSTVFETDLVNGVKFNVVQSLTNLGADTLILKAHGVPKRSGKYRYTFTTDGSIKNSCDFEVTFTSLLGTFTDPACKCLDIYEERPDAINGEYWLLECQATTEKKPVKTYCDLENGGWTLVWTFSEKTAYSTYNSSRGMLISGSSYSAFSDTPRNRATKENDTINYADYRLNKDEWRNFPNSITRPQLKVRITENPTDMNDEWALNNYGIASPRNQSENPIETGLSGKGVISQGKIFGNKWAVKLNGANFQGWDEINGDRTSMNIFSNPTYCTHWNFENMGDASFQVLPNRGGSDNTVSMKNINNAFGWFGETEVNHHFGKCGGQNGNDFDFSIKTCINTNLYPHSFNNGEGRYLQWFVR
ncbi:MAG: hypothetical protein LBR97_07220 [Dysgonamonadaceae bacterium]|jgi:hypothetical protein|nr:hypothetical protein [Dysgonamonadaceae bacterium]